MNFNMLGEWWPFYYFKMTMTQVPALIMYWIFRLLQGICKFFITLPENMFKLVTGTGAEWKWGAEGTTQTTMGGSTGNDIVMAFLNSSVVQTTFFTVLGFSIVLLVIFTVIALIRSEFTTDIAKSAKGPYINRALKGIMNFILVPVLSLVFVMGVNVLTRAVNSLFGGSNDTLANRVYEITLYGSERTSDEKFYNNYLKNGDYNANNTEAAQEAISRYNEKKYTYTETEAPYNYYTYDFSDVTYENDDDVKKKNSVSLGTLVKKENGIVSSEIALYTKTEKVLMANSFGGFYMDTIYSAVYDENDKVVYAPYYDTLGYQYVKDKEIAENKFNTINIFENANKKEDFDRIIEEMMFQSSSEGIYNWTLFCKTELKVDLSEKNTGYRPWQCAWVLAPTPTQMQSVDNPLECGPLVNFFYNPAQFHLIMGMAAAIILGWNLMGIVILLVKRALELAILFMISPVAVALYPLDDGAATNKWRGAWQGRLFAPATIVFAYNIFFSLVDLLSVKNISLPFWLNNDLFTLFWTLVVVMCMSSLLKTASKLLCEIVGAEDMIGNASTMANNAAKTAISAGSKIATVAAPVVGAAVNAGKSAFTGIKGRVAENKSKKDELKAADEKISDLAAQRAQAMGKGYDVSSFDEMIAQERAKKDAIANKSVGDRWKEKKADIKTQAKLKELKGYDDTLTADDIKNESKAFKAAQAKFKTDKRKGAISFAASFFPADNEAVKFATQMTDKKKRREYFMTPGMLAAKTKQEEQEKIDKQQDRTFRREQAMLAKKEAQEKAAEAAQAAKEQEAQAKEQKEKDLEVLAVKKIRGDDAKIAEFEAVKMSGDDVALNNFYEANGINAEYEKYKSRLDSSAASVRDEARKELDDEAKKQYDDKAEAAIIKNMEEMLPKLVGQLDAIDLGGLSKGVEEAIINAMNDVESKQKGFKNFDPQTQELLKAITACQGGISDMNTLLESLHTLSMSGFDHRPESERK